MDTDSRTGIEDFRSIVGERVDMPPHILADYERETARKLDHGDAKYGADAWMRHDMLHEALDEAIDLGNYAYLKWRQLRELECTPTIMVAMDAMVDMYAAMLPVFANVVSLINMLDEGDVPKSLSSEDFVGVQAHEPGEPTRLN